MVKWQIGLLIAALTGGMAVACGGKDKGSSRGDDNEGGAETTGGRSNDGGEEATGGRTQTGGREGGGGEGANAGSGNAGGDEATGGAEETGGSGNAGGDEATGGAEETGGSGNAGGDEATGGAPPATGGGGAGGGGGDEATGGAPPANGIDDLITAMCGWEFGCCDTGETTYRLGTSGGSVQDCIDDFVFQLHDSNQTANPFPSGTATGLLGTLGFTVNLNRVVENPAGIAECIATWSSMDCSTSAEPATHCAVSMLPGGGPCSLTNLFDPGLAIGDRCTLALTEGDGNDVECPAGTTCVPAGDPDNPETFPTCVQRGTEGDPCTNDGDCDWDFYCNADGDCTEKGDEGDDCSFNDPSSPVPNDEDAECKAGLRCNPNDLVCVANCEIDYPCDPVLGNYECPEGQSCRPVTVVDDATSWHTCQAIGERAADRCDENADCIDSRRCADGVCQADLSIGEDCTSDEECEAGSFCDLAIYEPDTTVRTPTSQCTAYFDAQEPCFPGAGFQGVSSGCNPNTAGQCVFVGEGTANFAWECRATLRQEGDTCYPLSLLQPNELSDCEPGLFCEYADDTATYWTCTTGAAEGDDCDDAYSNGDALFCGVGLFCDPTDAVCVAQVDPGGDCEDPNTNAAQPGLCKNGVCVDHWDGNGSFICTDAPVPTANEGDGLTCNG